MNDWLGKCHFGDVRDVLRRMIADGVQVQTIVTSPPYFRLRSYLPADHPDKAREIGSEPTLREFLDNLVGVFDLCRQALRDDGTMFVNMGDSYATNKAQAGDGRGMKASDMGLKPKDLMGQPWRLAFALQEAGWWLRQDIIWAKKNCMPESVTDRCTKSHEYIFLFAKSENYYFDQEAILEPVGPNTHARLSQDVQHQISSTRANGGAKTNGNMKAVARSHDGPQPGVGRRSTKFGDLTGGDTDGAHRTKAGLNLKRAGGIKNNASFDEAMAIMPLMRNKRSVWTVGSEPYSGAHFATFPRALIEPCILAGAPAGGVVLDPFLGSGTTAQVAEQMGRKWIGIDIDTRNGALQAERLRQPSLELEVAA